MARRIFEMYQYRQALVRMRQGDSDRQIAEARIMGRHKAACLRQSCLEHNWLDPAVVMPDDEVLANALAKPKRASTTVSSLAAYRDRIRGWAQQGVTGVAIMAALQREQGWHGSYSAVRRILADIRREEPVRLTFAHDRQWLSTQAKEVGVACTQLIDRLLSDKVVERLRAAQGVISLGETYGHPRLEAACARALAHDSPLYSTVKSILATGADKIPPVLPITPSAYANPRFVRDAATLFACPNPQPDVLH